RPGPRPTLGPRPDLGPARLRPTWVLACLGPRPTWMPLPTWGPAPTWTPRPAWGPSHLGPRPNLKLAVDFERMRSKSTASSDGGRAESAGRARTTWAAALRAPRQGPAVRSYAPWLAVY